MGLIRCCAIAGLVLLRAFVGSAQEPGIDTTGKHFRFTGDTLRVAAPSPLHHDSLNAIPFKGKSPGTAMLLSAVIPGAGQFYNESYWKVPIVTGLAIYFVSEWLTNNRRYISARNDASTYLRANNGTSDVTYAYKLSLREFYNDQRDSFAWYYLILYVVNLADAYVDASLFGFDVGGSLALRGAMQPRLTLRFSF